MAVVIPFKGILYNPDKVAASAVMAPPYDVVTPRHKDELYQKSPYNVIRIDFGKDTPDDSEHENRYTRAAAFLNDWVGKDVLLRDADPMFYAYEMEYVHDGVKMKTRGFLGAVLIEELGKGRVHPHEMTYSKPKSDRLNILRYCRANTSPIFSLYSSTEKKTSAILDSIMRTSPFIQAEDGDGFFHRLWRISDSASIESIKNEMADKDVFIADGHHRYETALEFKREMGREGGGSNGERASDYVLMFLSNMEDDGLTLLPTHRMVEIDSDIHVKDVLRKYFELEKVDTQGLSEAEAMSRLLHVLENSGHSFGLFLANEDAYYTLSATEQDYDIDLPDCLKRLDVSILHKLVFEKLLRVEHFSYEMNPAVAVDEARKGHYEAVFFLHPTDIKEVRDVALAGHRMPPKSTYFYPKLLTGMVIYKFSDS